MFEIGLVGLDTSHPEAFADLLDARDDTTLGAVWDGGTVRDEAYVTGLCDKYGVERCVDPTEMIDAVDAAMVLTVDWDTHRPLAVPFLEAGVPTFIDKPIAGSRADLAAIADAAKGTLLFGGSAIPFHPALSEFPTGLSERTLYCAGYNDIFYYGVHLTDTVRALVGEPWSAVTPRDEPGTVVDVEFTNGSYATLQLDGPDAAATFGVLDVSDRTRTARITTDGYERMYECFMDAFVETLRGERDESDRLIDGAALLLAVQAALRTGASVTPEGGELAEIEIDGEAFLADYAPYA